MTPNGTVRTVQFGALGDVPAGLPIAYRYPGGPLSLTRSSRVLVASSIGIQAAADHPAMMNSFGDANFVVIPTSASLAVPEMSITSQPHRKDARIIDAVLGLG